jgi:hypothetical protein
MMPTVLPDGDAGGTAVDAGAAAGAIAGRDIVAPADAGLGKPPAAGRDMVDEAEGEARMVAPATGFDPVAEAPKAGRDPVAEAPTAGRDPVAETPTAGRDPVAEADAGDVSLGEAVPARPAGGTAAGAAEDAAPAPAAGISVVPHCTQNFAPG